MSHEVYANGRAVSCKKADGKSICAFPDVCMTPPQTPATPPGVPVPYPNTGMASDTSDGSSSVKISGQEVMLKNKSHFKKSTGDEAGSAPMKGVVTQKNMGKVYFTMWSMDVKVEGENAVRMLDMTTHNHGSVPGNTPPWPYVDAGSAGMGGGGEEVEDAELEGEILEVSWVGGVDVARIKSKVTAPHWTSGENVIEDDQPDELRFKSGSKKPAAVALDGAAPEATLRVKVKITVSEQQPGNGRLSGQLGALTFEGDCPTAVGTHEVEMKAKSLPDVVRHFEGDVQWTLATPVSFCNLHNTTRLELFLVLKKPMAYYREGVWAEALRFLFKKASLSNVKTQGDVARWVTRYCHGGHGMVYDVDGGGGSHFGAHQLGADAFQLMDYMKREGDRGNVVNCYDQAAAIQSLCGAMGVQLDWIYLDPYGYINATNLVGVGVCNNPFYLTPDYPPNPRWKPSKKLVPPNAPDRSGFGNHAFARLGANILDACAGPHLGDETLRQYLVSAIDARRTISDWQEVSTEEELWDHREQQQNPWPGVTGVV